ncbi:MAG TPA: N-acetyltransferase [Caulobacteraceae bacterium]|nr:N-acetyltransferase [Caulobacteraceae bacterium]
MPSSPLIRNEEPRDAQGVAALVERAFGPGRYAKAAERLREGNTHRQDLSFVAEIDGRLAGSVRLWPIRIGGQPAMLLGPIAVDADQRGNGLGQTLVEHACDAAKAAGVAAVLLVGDAPWFERTGFGHALEAIMPGPVDQRRVLVRVLGDDAGDLSGPVTPH